MSNKVPFLGSSNPRELRIVLLGRTGDGKSSTGNTILGDEVFEEDCSAGSVTSRSKRLCREINGRSVTVIDTPGFFDTELSEEQMKTEILRCISLSARGPHAFLLVVKLDRHTDEEREAMRKVEKQFGEEALKFTIVLFTRGDDLKTKPAEKFLEENLHLKKFVQKCGGGYHVFNNKNKSDHSQVTMLLEKIDRMVEKNGGRCYSNEAYKKVEECFQQEKERLHERRNGARHEDRCQDVEEEARESFVKKCLKILVGVTAGAVLGALLGLAGAAVALLLSVAWPCALTGAAAVAGAAIGGMAAAEADGPGDAAKKAAEAVIAVGKSVAEGAAEIVKTTKNLDFKNEHLKK